LAAHLHRIEVGAAGGGQHDLRGALAVYGGSTAYADQVLALAAPAITANLSVVQSARGDTHAALGAPVVMPTVGGG